MTNFTNDKANFNFSVTDLTFQDLSKEGSAVEKLTSKSELFRRMYDAGAEICDVSRLCDSHYSFVYGVISSSREVRATTKQSASDDIRALAAQGKTAGEIAKALNKNYSFVFGVVKKYKASLPEEVVEEIDIADLAPDEPEVSAELPTETVEEIPAEEKPKRGKKA